MQRRAATVYVVFFLVVGAGAFSVLGVAQSPEISVSGQTYAAGDSFTVDDREYTVSEASDGRAQLTWVDESAPQSEAWEAHVQRFDRRPGSGDGAGVGLTVNQDIPTVEVQGTEYRVVVQPAADPTDLFLVEAFTLDENVTTVTQEGTTYVITEADGGPGLTPVHEFIQETRGSPEIIELSEGETLTYQDRTTTVAAVENETVTVEWTAPVENTITLEEGRQVTLVDSEYVAHFPSANRVQLSTDVTGYQNDVAVIESYDERMAGLWGVTILSGLAAMLILGMAFLPSRY